jgi:ankyrin repeat protein
VNVQEKDGKTPLHDAIERIDDNNTYVIVVLIRAGANIDARDK